MCSTPLDYYETWTRPFVSVQLVGGEAILKKNSIDCWWNLRPVHINMFFKKISKLFGKSIKLVNLNSKTTRTVRAGTL